MCHSEQGLRVLRHICEGGRNTGLQLGSRFRVIALPKFVLTGGNEERLLGTETTFFDCIANPLPQCGRRIPKIARNPCLGREKSTFLVPMWCRSAVDPALCKELATKQLTQKCSTK